MAKSYAYAIYDILGSTVGRFSSTATLLGVWTDGSPPRFHEGVNGGAGQLEIVLSRHYGAMGEPNEPNTDSTLTLGNRLDVLICDDQTFNPASPSAFSSVIYRGTIESVVIRMDGSRTEIVVTVESLGRIADQTWIESEVSFSATNAVGLAANIVTNYTLGLDWDANNPALSTGPSLTMTFKRQTITSVLTAIAEAAGADYLWWVTATGTVRFLQQTRANTGRIGASSTVRHFLSMEREIATAELRKSITNKIKRVVVAYAGGESAAQAGDYDSKDPREAYFVEEKMNSTDAATAAASILAAMNKVWLHGQVMVPDNAYDIETLAIGDVCRLHIPRILPTDASYAGSNDFNSNDVIIWGRQYDFDSITLEMESPREDPMTFLRRMKDTLDSMTLNFADINIKRLSATVLQTGAEQFYAPGGLRTITKAGVIGDGDFTAPADGLSGVDTNAGTFAYRTGGAWKVVTGV